MRPVQFVVSPGGLLSVRSMKLGFSDQLVPAIAGTVSIYRGPGLALIRCRGPYSTASVTPIGQLTPVPPSPQ